MQYETIILELLSRIKKLESDVNELKNFRNEFISNNSDLNSENSATANHEHIAYTKMTDDMIDICYRYGKKAAEGENIPDLADKIASTTGMNRNSAIMYLYAVQSMLVGTVFKRAISAKAIKKYYDNIISEYSYGGLKKAIRATRLHIDYRRSCGQNVDTIEKICDSYEKEYIKLI